MGSLPTVSLTPSGNPPEPAVERPFVPAKRSRAVTEAIIQRIVRQGWREGDSLGTEPELLAWLRVSRATFREAVRDLERHGVIVARRGRGLVVAAPARAAVLSALGGFIGIVGTDRNDVAEVVALLRGRGDMPQGMVVALLLEALTSLDWAGGVSASVPPGGRSDKLAAATAQRIAADIGKYAADARLGTEGEYLAAYGVSRSTLREALALLETQGIVVRRRGLGGGLFKGRPSPRIVAESAAIYLHYLRPDGEEVIAARHALEPEAAARAARISSPEARGTLNALLDAWTANLAELQEKHRAFHVLLAGLSGNAVLSLFVQLLMQSYYLVEMSEHADFLAGLETTHRAIADAVEQGDAPAARAAMIEHLEFTRNWTSAGLLRT